MATSFTRIILVLLSINVLLFIGGVRVIDDNDAFMNMFIDTGDYNERGVLNVSSDLTSSVDQPLQRSGTGILEFIDSIGAVLSVITFVLNLIFTPFGLFMGAGLPPMVGLIVGVPMVALMVLGLAYFMRSGS